jgi:hypothetical protein
MRPTVLLAAAALLPAAPLLAQRAPAAPFTLTLARPDAEFAEPYTMIGAVRELRDGRVVVADRVEKVVHLVDLARGTATRVGAEGGGPTEYRMPMSALAMPGDSTLIFDAGNMRYLVVAPDGGVARSFNPTEATGGAMGALNARGVDGEGNLYFLDRGLRGPRDGQALNGTFETPDSGTVVRYDLATGATTPVGRVGLARMQVTASGGGGEQRIMMRSANPFSAQDDWTVGLDGRLAVVRHDPYRVEWVAPNGQRVTGPTVSYPRLRVTDADKRAWAERARNPNNQVRLVVGGSGGGARAEPRNAPAGPPLERDDWPEFKPPFVGQAATVAPDGRLWVLRTREAGDDVPSYDVFDSYGARVGTVKLPPNARLVGFGRNSAYVVRTDEDDLQYLQRYRLF